MLSIGFLLLILITGCGKTNLFEGIAGGQESSPEDANANASRQLDNGEYSSAISSSTSVIDNSGATTEQKREAYALRGEAKLGNSGVEAGTLVARLSDSNTDYEGSVNLINSLVQNVTTSDISSAADDFLIALTENLTLRVIPGSTDVDLDNLSDRQLLAGFACALAAARLIVTNFDTNGDDTLSSTDFSPGSTNRSTDWTNSVSSSGQHAGDYIVKAVQYLGDAITNADFSVDDTVNTVRTIIDQVDTAANASTLTNSDLQSQLLSN